MEPTPKILSGDELKAKRHELFVALQAKALAKLAADQTKEACELTAAALKTIQEADETSLKVEGEEIHPGCFLFRGGDAAALRLTKVTRQSNKRWSGD
jgi:hypothetical protein